MDLLDVAAKLTIDTSSYTSGLEQAGGSTESFHSRLQRLQTEYIKAAAEVKVLQQALNEYVQETGNAEHAGEELAAMLADKQIEAAGAKAAIGELVDAEKDLVEEEEKSGEKGEEAGKKVKKAGDKAENAGEKIKKLVSALKTGAQAFSAIAAAAAAAVTAVGKTINDVAEYGDNVDKMSQKLGMSAKSYQEWDAVMQHAGTSIDSMQAGMKTLASAAEQGNDAFAKLGLSQSEIASMSQEELFSATITALQNVEDETQRTYLAGKLLGRGATELGPLLNMSAEETQQLKERVNELGGVMSDDAVKASATFKDNLQDLTTAFQGLKRGIVQQVLPGANMVLAGFTSLIIGEEGAEEKIDEGLKNVLSTIENVLPKLADKVMSLGESLISSLPNILNIGLEIIQSLVNGIVSNAGMIGGAVSDIVVLIVEKIGSLLPSIVTGALQLVGQLVTSLGQALPTLIPAIMDMVSEMALALTDPSALNAVIDGALQLVEGLAHGIVEALPTLIDTVPLVIQNLVNFLLQAIPQILNVGGQILRELVTGLYSAMPDLIAAVPMIMSSLAQGILGLLPEILAAGGEILTQLAWGIIDSLPVLIEKAPMIIQAFVDGFVGNFTALLTAGVQLIIKLAEGIINGIPILMEHIPEIVSEIGKAIVDAAPKLLEAGKSLVSGLWSGIKNAFSGKKNEVHVADSINLDFSSVESDAGAAASSVSNSISRINTALENVGSASSTNIDAQFTNLSTAATTAANNAETMLTGVTTTARTAFDGIVTQADAAKTQVQNTFANMGTEATATMAQAVQSVDFTPISQAAEVAYEDTLAAFDDLPNQFKAIWEQIKKTYNEVPTWFQKTFNAAYNNIVAIWQKLPSQFTSVWTQIKNDANTSMQELTTNANTWGSDLINNFTQGVDAAAASGLESSLQGVAEQIKSILGFSEPERGPLSNFHTFAPDMMQLFAKGVRDNKKMLTDTVEDAFDFKELISAPKAFTYSTTGGGSLVRRQEESDRKMDVLISMLKQYLPGMANQKIVLDSGTMVGEMLPRIDRGLAYTMANKARGNA